MSTQPDLSSLFAPDVNPARRQALQAMPLPRTCYAIAFTPRSGSSYLCDVLRNTGLLGTPSELLSRSKIASLSKRNVPAASADEFLPHVLKATRSNNGVSGLKASWFQFQEFMQAMQQPEALAQLKFIHLTRRDLAGQAVSLYRATQSQVFHTHIEHPQEKLAALAQLPYDFAKIDEWCRHLEVQEAGWRNYFHQHSLFPLSISYEEIEEDAAGVARRTAQYLERPKAAAQACNTSAFKKLGQRQSVEWACRFTLERDAARRAAQASPGAQP